MFLRYLKDLLQLLLSPRNGWEDVSYDGYDARKLFTSGFLPFVALAGMSVLCKWFYHADASLVVLLQQAIIGFVKFFASYYLASFFFSWYMPMCTDGAVSMNKCHTLIMYSLSVVALIDMLQNCLPMELSLAYLLPMYVWYIMWRGLRYMAVSFNGVATYMILCILTITVPPYLLQYLFNMIVPEY